MEQEIYDIIIIGAGPAGLTAGIYAGRYKLKSLIIGKLVGGIASETLEINNFPTYEKISGLEFTEKLVKQVKSLGIKLKEEEVYKVEKRKDIFKVLTSSQAYYARKVILATGTERKRLNVEGEKKLRGKGVSYCATCDAGFFKNKTVSIIGGGNSALRAALLLAKYAKKVYIIYRGSKFERAEPILVENSGKEKNIEVLFNSSITEIFGKEKVTGVSLNSGKKIELDGVFIEIGSVPEVNLAEQLGVKIDEGYVGVDKNQRTNIHGVYASGDITNNQFKQVLTSCSEGAIAARAIYEEMVSKN